jgi:phosphate transport system substrate-binding protein
MSQKNETTVLVLALLITLGLVGAGIWWFTRQSGVSVRSLGSNRTNQSLGATGETFAQVKGVPSGLFSYGGSSTWASIRKEVDPAIQTVWPQFRLRYTDPNGGAPSSGTGVRMLLDNQLDFSQSSIPVEDKEYKEAEQRGFKLKEIPVAIDGIAIAVNPSLNIPGLTVAQFKDIYAGKITNWSQVGGPNLKIKAYGKPERDAGSPVELVSTTTEALRQVAAHPGGIYYTSAPLVVPQCNVKPLPLGRNANELIPPYKEPFVPLSKCPAQRNQVNTEVLQNGQYPMSRRLLVVVKQNGQAAEQAGEAYANLLLTDQGQALIEKSGFVRIR